MVKQSHYSPWQALRVPGGLGSQILRQSAHEGGNVVSPKHRPPLTPGNIPGTHFCKRLSWPQGNSAAGRIMSMKNSVTPSVIDPATLRFVAQCLNHCATACPLHTEYPQVLGTTEQNVDATATWRPEFVCPCFMKCLGSCLFKNVANFVVCDYCESVRPILCPVCF
jgi:hypothetical protein